MTLTLAQCINMQAELDRYEPPPVVKRALSTILSFVAGGCNPPRDLIQLVQSFIQRATAQNRYGK